MARNGQKDHRQENKEFQHMKLTIATCLLHSHSNIRQLCYKGIQVTIISIIGLTCLVHAVQCPHVW